MNRGTVRRMAQIEFGGANLVTAIAAEGMAERGTAGGDGGHGPLRR